MITIKRRLMSGALAGIGTIACMLVASYQTAHEANKEVDTKKVAKLAGTVGLVAGVVWAVTPAATESHEEVLEHTKDKTYPSLRLLIRRAIVGKITPSNSSVDRIYSSRAGSDGFDEDSITDDEYAELMDEEALAREDELNDPFFEGPTSIFDRI